MRETVWYRRYKNLAAQLKKTVCTNIRAALLAVDSMVDEAHGYHYHRIAVSAHESLMRVIEEER